VLSVGVASGLVPPSGASIASEYCFPFEFAADSSQQVAAFVEVHCHHFLVTFAASLLLP